MLSTSCLHWSGADWCLESDAVTNLELQAKTSGGAELCWGDVLCIGDFEPILGRLASPLDRPNPLHALPVCRGLLVGHVDRGLIGCVESDVVPDLGLPHFRPGRPQGACDPCSSHCAVTVL